MVTCELCTAASGAARKHPVLVRYFAAVEVMGAGAPVNCQVTNHRAVCRVRRTWLSRLD